MPIWVGLALILLGLMYGAYFIELWGSRDRSRWCGATALVGLAVIFLTIVIYLLKILSQVGLGK